MWQARFSSQHVHCIEHRSAVHRKPAGDTVRASSNGASRAGSYARFAHDGLPVRCKGEIVATIKWNSVDHSAYVRCPCHDKCRKEKRLYKNARFKGQGRPLGFLAAWVIAAHKGHRKCRTHDKHAKFKPSYRSRKKARQNLKAEADWKHWADELEANDLGDSDSEPEVFN
jgi:hypothetical protein